MATTGTLKIMILEARLTRDTEMFGKMDPYVIIETRMQRVRTATQEDAGKTPAWADEVIDIDVKYIGDDMHLAIMDENMTEDETIGEATIKLSAFTGGSDGLDEWYEVSFKGEPAGHIHLKSKWEPTGGELEEKPEEEPKEQPVLMMSNGVTAPRNVVFQQPYYQ